MSWIHPSGIVKKIGNGIQINCEIHTSTISFEISSKYDVNTPKEYFAFYEYIPYKFLDDDMIIDFSNAETTIFENKEMILHQKPLDQSIISLSLKNNNYNTLTSLDGTRIISKYYNLVTVNEDK
ncbi:MAG: hypothetical protein EZS28_043231 [Streblomastix strix]|uniref:Uncharacterized protein n=1 Tax=Streblomastix strix TaxID=222440 RepID=A0A5J4TTJ5_9EUKA|nr:MAG: hypothetical protein EZS28_043231 [Streblomastix strix]